MLLLLAAPRKVHIESTYAASPSHHRLFRLDLSHRKVPKYLGPDSSRGGDQKND